MLGRQGSHPACTHRLSTSSSFGPGSGAPHCRLRCPSRLSAWLGQCSMSPPPPILKPLLLPAPKVPPYCSSPARWPSLQFQLLPAMAQKIPFKTTFLSRVCVFLPLPALPAVLRVFSVPDLLIPQLFSKARLLSRLKLSLAHS